MSRIDEKIEKYLNERSNLREQVDWDELRKSAEEYAKDYNVKLDDNKWKEIMNTIKKEIPKRLKGKYGQASAEGLLQGLMMKMK